MEVSLKVQRPFICRGTLSNGTHLKIKPFVSVFSYGRCNSSSQSSTWCKKFPGIMVSSHITAEYSRRRPRKISISKTKGPAPKGFMPKRQVGMSTQKRDQSDHGEKEGSVTSSSSEYSGPGKKLAKMKVDTGGDLRTEVDSEIEVLRGHLKTKTEVSDEVEETSVEIEDKADGTALARQYSALDTSDAMEKKETVVEIDEDITKVDIEKKGTVFEIDEDITEIVSETSQLSSPVKIKTDMLEEGIKQSIEVENKIDETTLTGEHLFLFKSGEMEEKGTVVEIDNNMVESGKPKTLDEGGSIVGKKPDMELLTKQKFETEEAVVETEEPGMTESLIEQKFEDDTRAYKQLLEDLAVENLLRGDKVFVYPQVPKPDQDIEVFLNRSVSALKDEPDVFIMGAFNDWRWQSFTKKLQKTDLKGDWWSCRVYVPKEAFKMDFVFFNGGDIYDNNNSKDFCVSVEGGMDAFAFEDFLLEEKRRELEKLAAEQAARERQEEEQRRLEEEKAAREADRAQAKVETDRRREVLRQIMSKAVRSVDGVWLIEPSEFKGEDKIRLYYNRSSGPLAHATEVWIHGGHNNWTDGLSILGRLVRSEKKGGDWWYADVFVPDQALVLDWVFADGPPGNARVYDNNHFQDFHTTVPKCMPEELYWVEEEHQIYRKLQEERRIREDSIREKVEKTARLKAETKEETMKMFLLSQKHIVYTVPLDVEAGSIVTVFYNPSNTVLNGKPDVWFRCSFNRWTHRNGTLPPLKMMPADSGHHVKATVKVPLDAYMMDFVFSEMENGGIYDNKNGMDYHIPVTGGVLKEPPMHIVHVSVEMAPIAKVGGLGDVVTSLSRAVQDLGHNVEIILPKYDCMNLSNVKDFQFHKGFHWGGTEIKVWFGKVEGLSVYFLEPQNGMFSAGCIYGRRNDNERFGFFCNAALEFLLQSGSHPDILHCHDWSSAPVAWLFKDHYMHYGLSNARAVFTIHNLEFGADFIGKAMTYSDKATTVSHTYSREVSGNPAIAPHLHKFHGILNGIDPDIWDPYNDKFIPVSYTSDNVVEGKMAAKEALQQKLGLRRSDHPLVGIITRLTVQKGIHLIKHAMSRALERNGQVVLLGSAPDPRIQNDFVNLANQMHSTHGDRVRLCLTYDEPLSHLIYAGADFILVPSIFEPCGLTQLVAMRYGAIPIVRKTGGLYDTVFDVDHDKERAQAQGLEPNGFSFDGADTGGVDYALNRAISAWYDGRDWFNSLCKRVMEQDWSWNRPALDYMELYYSARK